LSIILPQQLAISAISFSGSFPFNIFVITGTSALVALQISPDLHEIWRSIVLKNF
jgi:hypothetical protein